MKAVFKRNAIKEYVCTTCDTQFAWSFKCSWYGQYDKEPEAYFCSNKCKDKFTIKHKILN